MKKVSLIVTVLNEDNSILDLLNSISTQTKKPDEVIFVDGGSSDTTLVKIKKFSKKYINLNLKVYVKKGNRSTGRNHAIKLVKNELIAITDAGCILDKNWLKELFRKHSISKAPVIAGYYDAGKSTKTTLTDFQKAVVPYVLVMPDKVNPKTFLPATRSMLIEKNVFLKMGGFDTKLSDNEDYAFAQKLKNNKIKISFAKKAIVFWQPRSNLSEFYNMIFRFARGDIFAGIVRSKVLTIFLRYAVFAVLLLVNIKLFLAAMCFYTTWAIQKNKKYVEGGWKYLPTLQFTSDIAVMHGSVRGLLQKFL